MTRPGSTWAMAALVVLKGATLIDGTGEPPRPNAVVVVEEGRIVRVGDATSFPIPEGAEVKDLTGRFLIPGLIDMHAHVAILPPDERGRLKDHDDRTVSERVLKILLASGITTVRNPAAPAADGVALREAVRSGRIAGPRIFTAGEALNRA
ncbi:MAG: amidohydrolase family protein, partial [Acidobacteria bacterium]|nr:amidohydrolase family protein [Acidobacteriota bacterium]